MAQFRNSLAAGLLARPQPSVTDTVLTVVAGNTRYATGRMLVEQACALEGASYKGAIVVAGDGDKKFADALSAAGLAGMLDYPLVMVNGAGLDAQSRAALDAVRATNGGQPLELIVIGGTKTITEETEGQLADYGAVSARIAGSTRYDTNLKIYEYGKTRGTWDTENVFVATGENYPDALAVAPYLVAKGAPIVLANPAKPATLANARGVLSEAGRLVALGGGKSVVDSQLSALGMSYAERLAGSTRYKTAAAIVEWELAHGMSREGAGMATGENYPDALVSSFLLGKTGSVLVLADGKKAAFAVETAAALEPASGADVPARLYVFGGTGSMPEPMYDKFASAMGWGDYEVNIPTKTPSAPLALRCLSKGGLAAGSTRSGA